MGSRVKKHKTLKKLANGGENTRYLCTLHTYTHTHTYNIIILYVHVIHRVHKNNMVHEIQGENLKPTPLTTLVFALEVW